MTRITVVRADTRVTIASRGVAGFTPTFTMGDVTQDPVPAATLTETAPNAYRMDLALPAVADGSVGVRQTADQYTGTRNMFSANRAGIEDGNTTGFTFTVSTGAADAAAAKSGNYGLRVTSTAAGTASAFCYGTSVAGSATLAIPPGGGPYRLTVACKAPSITSVLSYRVYWWKADKSAASPASSTGTLTLTSAYQVGVADVTAPADAEWASFRYYWTAAAAGEVVHLDELGFWPEWDGAWALPDDYTIGPFLADGRVASTSIADGAVTPPALADDAVTTPALADGNVTAVKLAGDAVEYTSGLRGSLDSTAGVLAWDSIEQRLLAVGGLLGVSYVYAGADLVADVRDSVAPVNVLHGGVAEWYAGSHATTCWLQAAGALTLADVGKVWESGADRITLMDVTGGNAVWSQVHDAGLTTRSLAAPSGTYTRSGSPDITFTAPDAHDVVLNTSTAYTGPQWSDGYNRAAWRRYEQSFILHLDWVAAQQASVGSAVALSALSPAGTVVSDWVWPGDVPGTCIVDTALTAHIALDVQQWSGLQQGVSNGSPQNAFVGVVPGHSLAAWNSSPPSTVTAAAADWADGIPTSVALSRGTYGGVALGILDTDLDRTDLTGASVRINSSRKTYPVAAGPGNGVMAPGDTHWCRGFRSVTADTSDRHLHLAVDPVTGVTHWWLMAGSTGLATHPATERLAPGRVTQTRGTATVDRLLLPAGLTVTGAGWAEGTIA